VATCEELQLTRLLAWATEVLERPADCSNVTVLLPEEYVHLARKLHVKYVGPPSPSAHSPLAAFGARRQLADIALDDRKSLELSHYLPASERRVLDYASKRASVTAPIPRPSVI